MEQRVIYTDGGCRKTNPGPAACAFYCESTGQVGGSFLGTKTNNEAEYAGLLLALDWAYGTEHLASVKIISDSEVMVKQIDGRYKCQSEKLMPLWAEAKSLIALFDKFEIEHRKRDFNKEADAHYNKIMDEAGY
jgi:ribonuclease HI